MVEAEWLPKDIHILIPRACKFVSLHGMDFASMIKDIEKGEIIQDSLVGPSVIPRVLIRGRQEGIKVVICYDRCKQGVIQGRGHEPNTVASF